MTLIRRSHVLHLGAEGLIERVDSTVWGGINSATLSFNGAYTAGSNDKSSPLTATTGSPYADFLLGYSRSWSAGSRPEYAGRQKSTAAFIQDDWKVNPKLTVNLGVRWEGRTGWYDAKNNVRSFDPTITNPATQAPGAMWYATTHANGRTALEAPKFNNWLPRVGLAYQLDAKTTVRTGFGLYSFPWSAVYSNGVGAAFGSSGNETDSTNNAAPVVLLSSDGNTNYQGAKGAPINSLYKAAPTQPDSYNGQGVSFAQYDQPVPSLEEWNLDVARQVTGNTVVELAYVGSRGRNLAFVTDLNQVPQSRLAPNDAQFRPYPEFQSITGVTAQGYSNYNALEATVARRMSNGFEFNFNYTWSHMLSNQDSSGWNSLQGSQPYQDAYNPAANYGASNFDIRNMLKGQAIYQLPFGTGRRFLNNSPALNQLIGGWALSGTWMSQGGNPFTPYMLVNNSYALSSNMSWYPNQVGNPRLANPGINGWFNTAAFAAPAPGTFGNMRRNSVYGPGMQDMNASLHKRFQIRERVAFDFSANATNVLNHPSFGQPDAAIGPGHTAQIRSVTVGGRSMDLIGKISF